MKRTVAGLVCAAVLAATPLHAENVRTLTVRDLVYSSILGGDLRAYIAGVLDGQQWAAFMLSKEPPDMVCADDDISLSRMQDVVRKRLSRFPKGSYDKPAGGAIIAILTTAFPCK